MEKIDISYKEAVKCFKSKKTAIKTMIVLDTTIRIYSIIILVVLWQECLNACSFSSG